RDPYLCDLLRQLMASPYPAFDVVVIDQNESHDAATAALFAQYAGRVQVVPQPPRGLMQALLLGMRAARGEILLFLDDDIIAAPDLLAAHAANYRDPRIGGVGGLVLRPGALPSPRRHWLLRLRPSLRPFAYHHDFAGREIVAAAPGGNMSFRAAALGGGARLDSGIRTHHTEIEICQQVAGAGWKIVHDPAARVVHLAAPGGTRLCRGAQQDIFTDLHYVHRKYVRGLDRAVLDAIVLWILVVRQGLFADPIAGLLNLWRFLRGYCLASRRAATGAARLSGAEPS
ncbi:MAG: glycosyltransferase family 2 protein, partial [Terriglobales bacterium]